MQLQPINDEAFLRCVSERSDAAAAVHSWESFKHTMGVAPPKPPGMIARRRLLGLAHAAYDQDDMPAFIDAFSKGLSPLSFILYRGHPKIDLRIFACKVLLHANYHIKLFDAAVLDRKLVWACLAIALGIPSEDDGEIPAVFKPLLLDYPEFIELRVGSNPASLLLAHDGESFFYKNKSSGRIDLLGAAILIGATGCIDLLLEKTIKLIADAEWGNQAKMSLQSAADFAFLNHSRVGTYTTKKLCTDLSAALETIQPVASLVHLSTPPPGPDCTQLILERIDSMALRIDQLVACVQELRDENQALRDASKPLGFDPLSLTGRRRESAPLTAPVAPGSK